MSLEKVFQDLRAAIEKYNNSSTESSKVNTPEFNAFEVLYALELPLSRMIGELLNLKGTHLQGSAFLRLFIKQFIRKSTLEKSENVSLTLEHHIGDGRIDIFIDFDNKYGVAIENKPYADDQELQIVRYTSYLEERYGKSNYYMLYLSADGSGPSKYSLPDEDKERIKDNLIVLSYGELRSWVLKCAEHAKLQKAERLSIMLMEFAEYIYRVFCGKNSISEEFMQDEIKENILEAFEIVSQWNSNKDLFRKVWMAKINNLINVDLPELLFKELVQLNVINRDWEYFNDHFDINKFHLRGVKFKKKEWAHFSIGFTSMAQRKITGSRSFFPVIIANKKITPATDEQKNRFNSATESDPKTNWIGDGGKMFWSADFSNVDYKIWSYEHWSEIKPGGKTVRYLADYLSKLITACVNDIDAIEDEMKK